MNLKSAGKTPVLGASRRLPFIATLNETQMVHHMRTPDPHQVGLPTSSKKVKLMLEKKSEFMKKYNKISPRPALNKDIIDKEITAFSYQHTQDRKKSIVSA
jgi:hypothetical protein